MIWPLFKANIKNNRFLWILMTTIYCFYIFMIVSMFDSENTQALNEMLELLPEELIKALGFDNFGSTLIEFISGYINGILIFFFPLVISIVVNHRLLATLIDKGSLAYVLSTPNSRKKIALTQAVFSIVSITLLFIISTIITIIICALYHPGYLDIGKLLLINLYSIVLYIAIGGIGFFGSAISSESKHSLAIGVGIPLGFYVLKMLGNINEKFSWIGKLSMYALFDPDKMIALNSFAFIGMGILFIIGISLYISAIYIFDRRNLYI